MNVTEVKSHPICATSQKLEQKLHWEFLQDSLVHQRLETPQSLANRTVTPEIARQTQCGLVKRFLKVLVQHIPDIYAAQREQLTTLTIEIIPNISLIALKNSILALRDAVVKILISMDDKPVLTIRDAMEDEPMPFAFLILFDIATHHNFLNQKCTRDSLPIAIMNGRQMRFVSLAEAKQVQSEHFCRKMIEKEEFTEYFRCLQRVYELHLD